MMTRMDAHEHTIPLAFRLATEHDVAPVVELVTSAYRGDTSRIGWTTEADVLDGGRIDPQVLLDDITRPRSQVLLAEHRDTGTLIACAHLAEDDGAGYFGMFAVSPEYQGRGVGKTVLSEAERIVYADWKLPLMRMAVIDLRDELIAFYQRRGYHRTGRYQPFPYGDARFGLPRRDDLRFEILEKQRAIDTKLP